MKREFFSERIENEKVCNKVLSKMGARGSIDG
jgi:hypothetical protein